jgi:oligopeptidase A
MKFRILMAVALAAAAVCAFAGAATASDAPVLPANTGIAWDLSPAQINSTCDALTKSLQRQIATIDAVPQAQWTWQNSMAAVESAEADFGDALVAQFVLNQIAPDKSVRDASTACQEKAQPALTEINSDPKIYAMATYWSGPKGAQLDQADRKLAELYVEGGRRAGAGLSETDRNKVNQLFDKLNNLQRDFGIALSEEATTIPISKAEAKSLPPGFVATLKSTATGYDVPVNESTFGQFMTNESARDARKRFSIASSRRGGMKNIERLEQAIALRDQLAHLLGFQTWAAYRLDGDMAKDPNRVTSFLTQIDSALLPKARQELAQLQAYKKSTGDRTTWEPWDYAYYENKLVKARYAVDEEQVRQYFPVDHVITSILDIYQKLLSVKFAEITPANAWAPGVREFSIADARTGEPIGWFYLDLFPRTGKYGHFASFPLRGGRLLSDGSYQKPVDAIIGNWPAAAPGKPALLSHDDVVTFFHEFGHCMHSTLSRAKYETLYGTAVRQDFVEAPSQMLENWMWQPSILKQVSSNVSTGQPLPDALIAKMVALKHVADGADYTNQAFLAMFDMTIHSSGPNVDVIKTWNDLKVKMTTSKVVPGTYGAASFTHMMGGYDAGYYGYLWSLVYAQDMFTRFKAGGLESPVVGMDYRKDILEPGATEEPDVLITRFLGRPISYDAFYEELGIKR